MPGYDGMNPAARAAFEREYGVQIESEADSGTVGVYLVAVMVVLGLLFLLE